MLRFSKFFKKFIFINENFSCFSEDILNFDNSTNLNGYSIDTSRARSNAHVVSMCAKKLNMLEVL